MEENPLISNDEVKYCLDIAKQLCKLSESENGVNTAKLHSLLGLLNYSIQYATIVEVTKSTMKETQLEDKKEIDLRKVGENER